MSKHVNFLRQAQLFVLLLFTYLSGEFYVFDFALFCLKTSWCSIHFCWISFTNLLSSFICRRRCYLSLYNFSYVFFLSGPYNLCCSDLFIHYQQTLFAWYFLIIVFMYVNSMLNVTYDVFTICLLNIRWYLCVLIKHYLVLQGIVFLS